MKLIPLTQGYFAIVDDADYEWLSQFKWRIQKKPNNRYYARTSIKIGNKYKTVGMHRLIMNSPQGMDVDHINRNGLDNRRANLRVCTRSQNIQNTSTCKNSSSQYKGVSWSKDRKLWCAAICFNSKRINLGRFRSESDAIQAYDQKAKELFGEFANTNF